MKKFIWRVKIFSIDPIMRSEFDREMKDFENRIFKDLDGENFIDYVFHPVEDLYEVPDVEEKWAREYFFFTDYDGQDFLNLIGGNIDFERFPFDIKELYSCYREYIK
ncbi:MAG: hypothetical protein IAA72_02820 [Spirochaetes bacterium]|uniref:Uncharacterized protein n=1 Tax=Candidatus Ornithospirochaeta stercoravium TaxID=2840897 RepID=A0A9D9IBV3_9SPIO|nr:hypothetical protein [Candidatus Ornithospirochaeta stercoravium]